MTPKSTGLSTSRPATFVRAEPQLLAHNIGESVEFYAEQLGFSVAFAYGEPPFYAQVYRGNAYLNLRHVDHPAFDPEWTRREAILSATIAVDDAKSLFAEYEERAVDFEQPLRTEEWGAETFIVRDPDGNLILFAGRAEALATPSSYESDAGK